MRTPGTISKGIKRLVEGHSLGNGVPSSKRIIQDCDRALDSMRTVCKHQGSIVPGLADRNGNCYTKQGTTGLRGKRVKNDKLQECVWLHLLVRGVKEQKQSEILEKFTRTMGSADEDESECDEDSAESD